MELFIIKRDGKKVCYSLSFGLIFLKVKIFFHSF